MGNRHKNPVLGYDKYNTWSRSFDTWPVYGFCLHIGLATTVARPICDKDHRLAMYQMTVTMYYIRIISHPDIM